MDDRFESLFHDIGLKDNLTGKEYIYFSKEVIDLMNGLNDENEELAQINQELKQDNDIKFWKLQLIEQWNKTQIITHELSLAMDNGYEVSDEFKTYLDDLKKKHEEHIEKIKRLGLND